MTVKTLAEVHADRVVVTVTLNTDYDPSAAADVLAADINDHDRHTEQRRAGPVWTPYQELKRQLSAAQEAREIETKRATQLNTDLITQTNRASHEFRRAEENRGWAERAEVVLAQVREQLADAITRAETAERVADAHTKRADLAETRANRVKAKLADAITRAETVERVAEQREPFISFTKLQEISDLVNDPKVENVTALAVSKTGAIMATTIEQVRAVILR